MPSIAVRHGRTVAHVHSVAEAAELMRSLAAEPADMPDSCIPRITKHVLQCVENAHGQRYQGLGKAVSRVRQESGPIAARLIRNLNEAAGFVRHLTEQGEAATINEIERALAGGQPAHAHADPEPQVTQTHEKSKHEKEPTDAEPHRLHCLRGCGPLVPTLVSSGYCDMCSEAVSGVEVPVCSQCDFWVCSECERRIDAGSECESTTPSSASASSTHASPGSTAERVRASQNDVLGDGAKSGKKHSKKSHFSRCTPRGHAGA